MRTCNYKIFLEDLEVLFFGVVYENVYFFSFLLQILDRNVKFYIYRNVMSYRLKEVALRI